MDFKVLLLSLGGWSRAFVFAGSRMLYFLRCLGRLYRFTRLISREEIKRREAVDEQAYKTCAVQGRGRFYRIDAVSNAEYV